MRAIGRDSLGFNMLANSRMQWGHQTNPRVAQHFRSVPVAVLKWCLIGIAGMGSLLHFVSLRGQIQSWLLLPLHQQCKYQSQSQGHDMTP